MCIRDRFEGAVPASEALARSLNIPAVTMLQKYGAPKFHTFLRQIGLKTINRPASHYGLSLILGGAEATLWDVTNTYAYMGRSLLQLPQTECSLLLSDSENSEAVTSAKTTDIFQPGAVWQTFNALTEVNRPEEIDWKSIPSMHPIAWKTGTSHGFRDAWAVGVTPHYAIGVWVGNATGEGKPGLVGARTAGPVLFDIFSLLPPTQWFKRPGNVFVKTEVCRKSGHLKGRFCEETDTLLILPAGLKTEACPYHHLKMCIRDSIVTAGSLTTGKDNAHIHSREVNHFVSSLKLDQRHSVRIREQLLDSFLIGYRSVSYTHLDVYKRQV